jgi:hypothetical protein
MEILKSTSEYITEPSKLLNISICARICFVQNIKLLKCTGQRDMCSVFLWLRYLLKRVPSGPMSLEKQIPKHVAEFPDFALDNNSSTLWVGVGLDHLSFKTYRSSGHAIYLASGK